MGGLLRGSLRHYRDQTRKISGLAVLQLISAQLQTAALVIVIPLATTVADGEDRFDGKLGPVQFESDVTVLATLAATAIVLAIIVDVLTAAARSRVMSRWEYARREQVIKEYLRADYATQAAERLGTLGTLTTYVNRGSVGLGSLVNLVGAALSIGVFVTGALLIDYRAALFLIVTLLGLSVLLRPLMLRTKRFSKQLSAVLVDYGREVTEATRMARDIRVFHAEAAIGDELTKKSFEVSQLRQRSNFISGVTAPAYRYIGMLLVVAGLGASASLPAMDVTEFGAIALLLLRSMSAGSSVQNAYQSFLDSAPYLDNLEEMRRTYQERATVDGSVPLESVHRLELDRLRFSYDGETDALASLSATFHVGEIIGIVGRSGSGKSTLSQLIMRLREPTSGAIRANGMDASEYTLRSWYRHVSLVPQDPRLLHTTVAENIAFLDPSITREQVVEAAKAAGIHEVVETLDAGYDTLIGPAFRDLSGGQIQRIGIARALARGTQVLVLDEPTSALDVHSEEVIQTTLEQLRGKVLVLIIAHRLSTLGICDRIMVMEHGTVETIGSLQEVSERSEFFRRALDLGTLEIADPADTELTPRDDR